MNYSKIINQVNIVSDPIQFDLLANVQNYQEVFLPWNPISIIKGALFFQFDVITKQPLILSRYPDTCPIFAFCFNENTATADITGMSSEMRPIKLEPNTTHFCFKPMSITGSDYLKMNITDILNSNAKFGDLVKDDSIIVKIALTKSFNERIRIFIDYAKENLIGESYKHELVEYCSASIKLSCGAIDLGKLAQSTGYTEQYCRTKFKETYGMVPKKYSRIIRLHTIMHYINQNPQANLLDIALKCGFYDQAHFINEFKFFMNETPAQFACKVKQFQTNLL